MMVAAVNTSTPNRKVPSRINSHENPKRPPLLPSEDNNTNNNGPRRTTKAREVASRYLSSTASSTSTSTTSSSSGTYSSTSSSSNSMSTPSFSRRFASPIVQRTVTATPAPSVIKRSQSVERRRQGTPRPGTPEVPAAVKMLVNSKRSLSVSFQGESVSVPISKAKPAPVGNVSNVRKGTPERRKVATPVRELNREQRDNSNLKVIDKQRWPARSINASTFTRSVDFTSERGKFSGSGGVTRGLQNSMIVEGNRGATVVGKVEALKFSDEADVVGSTRSAEESSDPIPSDTDSVSSGSNSGVQESVRGGARGIVVPARFWQETNNRFRRLLEQPGSPVSKSNGLRTPSMMMPPKLIGNKKLLSDSPTSSPKGVIASRGQSSPLRGAVRPASPSKDTVSFASFSQRGVSPSRVRNGVGSTVTSSLGNTSSVLNFAGDARRAKVGENRIVDAHQLRLLYNQHLQWRFANARADDAMLVQKRVAEVYIVFNCFCILICLVFCP